MGKMVLPLMIALTLISTLSLTSPTATADYKEVFSRYIPDNVVIDVKSAQIGEVNDPEWGSVYVIRYLDLNGRTRVAITISKDGKPIKMTVDDRNVEGRITKEEAIKTAESYVASRGLLPEDHGLVKVVKIDDVRSYDAWFVYWEHEVNGVKVRDDHLTVKVGPTGVLGFSKRWSNIRDTDLQNIISENEAIAIARNAIQKIEYFQKNNVEPKVVDVHLEVVPVNLYWTGEPVAWPKEKALAYVVGMSHSGGKLEVWVDARTGEVIGGDQTRGVRRRYNYFAGALAPLLIGALVILGIRKYRSSVKLPS